VIGVAILTIGGLYSRIGQLCGEAFGSSGKERAKCEYKGKIYYFSAEGCKMAFQKDRRST